MVYGGREGGANSILSGVPQYSCLRSTGNLVASYLQTCLLGWSLGYSEHGGVGGSRLTFPADVTLGMVSLQNFDSSAAGGQCCLPEVGGVRPHAAQGDVTCFAPVMPVAVTSLGKEGRLTLLVFTHYLCFTLPLTKQLNCESFEVTDH